MPDPTNGLPSSTDPTGGSQGATAEILAQLQASISALGKMAPTIKALSRILKEMKDDSKGVSENTDKMRKSSEGYHNELRKVIEDTDDLESTFENLSKLQQRYVRDGFKSKDYREVLGYMKQMAQLTDTVGKKSKLYPTQALMVKKQTEDLRRSIISLSGEIGKAFDPGKVLAMMSPLMHVNEIILKASKSLKGMTGMRRDIHGAAHAVSHVFGQQPHLLDKWLGYRDTAREIGRKQKDLVSERKSTFTRHKGVVEMELDKLPPGASRSDKRKVLKGMGYGLVGSEFLMNHYNAEEKGRSTGSITKLGLNTLARGEGSLGRGLVSTASGFLESGAASVAMRAAPWLAIAEVLTQVFDHNQKMNSDVNEKLGVSGIYGGKDAIDAIRNVRSNLNSGGVYSSLGIGYDKNLAIANALAEGGLSNKSLTNEDLGHDGRGFNNGSFGSLQRNVYAYGRVAGLNSDQTMMQTIKLVTQYKQSLVSTEDFFVQINKDVQAANISTTQYLTVMDSVNDHYARSNKLIMATVDTMRLLSLTGRNTADDLKEGFEYITNGGKDRSLEQRAYLNQELLSHPEEARRVKQMRENQYTDDIQNVVKAFGHVENGKYDEKYVRDLFTKGKESDLIGVAKSSFSGDPIALQAASASIDRAASSRRSLSGFNYAQSLGSTQGGVALAAQGNATGSDITSQRSESMVALRKALSIAGVKTSDFFNPSKEGEVNSNLRLSGLLQDAFGGDSVKILSLLRHVNYDAASAGASVAQLGMSGAEGTQIPQRKAYLEQMFNNLSGAGMKIGPGKDKVEELKKFMSNEDNRNAAIGKLQMMDSTRDDAFSNPVAMEALRIQDLKVAKEEAMQKATQIAAGTRGTAEIFADAFAYLFNKIQTPLDFIAKVVAGYAKYSIGASDKSLVEAQNRLDSHKADFAMSGYDSNLKDLLSKRDADRAAGIPDKEDLNKNIAHLRDQKDSINGFISNMKDPSHKGLITQDQVNAFISAVDSRDLPYQHTDAQHPDNTKTIMDALGVKMPAGFDPTHPAQAQVTASQSQWDKAFASGMNPYQLDQSKYTIIAGKDAKGNNVYTINNYHSVGYTAMADDGSNKVNTSEADPTKSGNK